MSTNRPFIRPIVREYCATAILLRAEVWADLRWRHTSGNGRPLRSAALAQMWVADLELADPERAERIKRRQRRSEQREGLVSAVNRNREDARHLAKLQSICAMALNAYGPTPAALSAMRAHDVDGRDGRRCAG